MEAPHSLSEDEEELPPIDEDVIELDGSPESLQEAAAAAGLVLVEGDEQDDWTDLNSEAPPGEELKYDDSHDNYLRAYQGHSDAVLCVALLPSGLVVSGDCAEETHLWSSKSGEGFQKLKVNKDSVVKASFSPDGSQLCTAALDNSLRVFKLESEEEGKKQKLELQHTIEGPSGDIEFLEWHATGKVILTGGKDKAAWLFSGITGNYLQIFSGHSGELTAGCFTPDGKSVVTAGLDAKVKVWNPKTGVVRYTLEAKQGVVDFHSAGVTALKCFQDLMATGDQAGGIYLSSWKTGKVFASLTPSFSEFQQEEDEQHAIETLDWKQTLDRRWLGSGSMDCFLRCYETTKSPQKWSEIELTCGVVKLEFLKKSEPNRAIVLAGLVDGRLVVADMQKGETLRELRGHQDSVLDFVLSESEEEVVSSGDDNRCLVFRVWEAEGEVPAGVPVEQASPSL